MKTLYLDLFSGISGDMFLGALIDLGMPFGTLQTELQKLGLTGYHLHMRRDQRAAIAGVKFDVHIDSHAQGHAHAEPDTDSPTAGDPHSHAHHHHPHPHPHGQDHDHSPASASDAHEDRSFASIRALIQASSLSPWVRERATAVFERLAVAEGRIHGLPPDQVHFHEVGAIDSIVDIVGACIALEHLGRPAVLASPVVDGTGFLHCAHGRYPLPGPATLAILGARSIPVSQCEEPHELITPTGAALLAEFVQRFEPLRGFVAERIGFGLGTRENRTRPNALRVLWGHTLAALAAPPGSHDWETDTIAVLETNLDDISSEILGHFVTRALDQGALDAFFTPIQMKKQRPGVLLTVLCAEADADRFAELILRETSSFGVRRTTAERRKLRRESRKVITPWGEVEVKFGRLDGHLVQTAPEYESCRRIAEAAGVPVRQVFDAARRAADAPR